VRRGLFTSSIFGRTVLANPRFTGRRLIALLVMSALLALNVVVISGPAYAATAPGVPTALTGTAGNAEVALTWTAPANDGGAAVTDYRIEYKLAGGSTWFVFADGISTVAATTVTGLSNASTYSFQVAAINTIGPSTFSTAETSTPQATTPGAVTALAASPGSSQLGLTWVEPASSGGLSITDYVVQYKLTSASTWSTFPDGTSTTASTTITDLVNGTGYEVRTTSGPVPTRRMSQRHREQCRARPPLWRGAPETVRWL
jgi:hypothetical protein